MSYKDEDILKAKRAMEQASRQEEERKHDEENLKAELKESIFDGKIHIYGEVVEFSRRKNEEYGISIYMPTSSYDLDDTLKSVLYPMESRPKYVYGNATVNLVITLNLTSHKIPEDKIEAFLAYTEKMLRAIGPKVTHLKKQVIDKDTYKMGVVEFVSSAIDTRVYNTTFYVVVNEQLLIGNINFPMKYKDRQMQIVKEMLESFQIEEKTNDIESE